MRCLTVLLCTPLVLLLAGCEKYALDRQMEELCKKDGGITVVETVKLAPSEFSKDGVPLYRYWLDQSLIGTSARLGPDYKYLSSRTVLKSGDPVKGEGRLVRFVVEIYRTSDGRLLGRSTSYGRSGGDFIVLGHPSSRHCPTPSPNLLGALFQKGD